MNRRPGLKGENFLPAEFRDPRFKEEERKLREREPKIHEEWREINIQREREGNRLEQQRLREMEQNEEAIKILKERIGFEELRKQQEQQERDQLERLKQDEIRKQQEQQREKTRLRQENKHEEQRNQQQVPERDKAQPDSKQNEQRRTTQSETPNIQTKPTDQTTPIPDGMLQQANKPGQQKVRVEQPHGKLETVPETCEEKSKKILTHGERKHHQVLSYYVMDKSNGAFDGKIACIVRGDPERRKIRDCSAVDPSQVSRVVCGPREQIVSNIVRIVARTYYKENVLVCSIKVDEALCVALPYDIRRAQGSGAREVVMKAEIADNEWQEVTSSTTKIDQHQNLKFMHTELSVLPTALVVVARMVNPVHVLSPSGGTVAATSSSTTRTVAAAAGATTAAPPSTTATIQGGPRVVVVQRTISDRDEKILRFVASQLDDNWQDLSKPLQVLTPSIVRLKQEAEADQERMRYEMLASWYKKQPLGVNKIEMLAEILNKCQKKNVVSLIEDYLRKQK